MESLLAKVSSPLTDSDQGLKSLPPLPEVIVLATCSGIARFLSSFWKGLGLFWMWSGRTFEISLSQGMPDLSAGCNQSPWAPQGSRASFPLPVNSRVRSREEEAGERWRISNGLWSSVRAGALAIACAVQLMSSKHRARTIQSSQQKLCWDADEIGELIVHVVHSQKRGVPVLLCPPGSATGDLFECNFLHSSTDKYIQPSGKASVASRGKERLGLEWSVEWGNEWVKLGGQIDEVGETPSLRYW